MVACYLIASALLSAIQVSVGTTPSTMTVGQEDVITGDTGSAHWQHSGSHGASASASALLLGHGAITAVPGASRTQRSSGLPDYCTKRSHTSGLALHVCGGVCRRRWQDGLPACDDHHHDVAAWLAAGAPPPRLRILLVPRLFAANFIAAYIHDMVCDLEARGWITLDLDTVVQTPDIQARAGQEQGNLAFSGLQQLLVPFSSKEHHDPSILMCRVTRSHWL